MAHTPANSQTLNVKADAGEQRASLSSLERQLQQHSSTAVQQQQQRLEDKVLDGKALAISGLELSSMQGSYARHAADKVTHTHTQPQSLKAYTLNPKCEANMLEMPPTRSSAAPFPLLLPPPPFPTLLHSIICS
jgi:hypothetical protein